SSSAANTPTVRMPSSAAARATRIATSARFAISRREMGRLTARLYHRPGAAARGSLTAAATPGKNAPMPTLAKDARPARHHCRFHAPHAHLSSVFGDDWFGRRAESFARFSGTPTFLVAQSVIVGFWIALNVSGLTAFDLYPFILLNLAFSLQAAYA